MHERIAAFVNSKTGMGFLVPDYYLIYAAAIVFGTYLAVREAERKALNPVSVFRACLVIVLAAVIGARLFVVVQYGGYYRLHLAEIPRIWEGGTASTGAYIGGIVAAFVAAAGYRLPIARFFDCCAPSVAAAIILGRIGCFLNGCCYGSRSDLPWAVSFPAGTGPYHDHLAAGLISAGSAALPIHPTQLYEALYVLGVFVLLLVLRRAQREEGELTAVLFVLYPLGRIFSEFLRGDERGVVGFLSMPQVLALALLIAAGTFLVGKRIRRSADSDVINKMKQEIPT